MNLIAFAATVIVTRIYLQMAGYPQIGGGNVHISHVLWGGLLLYAAAVIPLVRLESGALTWSALLSGVGVGLFIDEVGKFVTASYDYFYPPAAPAIYAFFLLGVLLYLYVGQDRAGDPRAELYRAVELLPDLLDGGLDEDERERLAGRLARAQQGTDRRSGRLATVLAGYLEQERGRLQTASPGFWQELGRRGERFARRLGQAWHRRIILVLLGLSSLVALISVAALLVAIVRPGFRAALQHWLVTNAEIHSVEDRFWFLVRVGLEIVVSFMAGVAFWQLWRRHERSAIRTASFALLLSLTTVVLLTFYLDQFEAISMALQQFVAFLFVDAYRRWYLTGDLAASSMPPSTPP